MNLLRTIIPLSLFFLLTCCGSHDKVVTVPVAATPSIAPDCETRTATIMAEHRDTQLGFYRAHGGTVPVDSHLSTYEPGTNGRVVVLVHGFLSSPVAMKDLAASFHDAGFSVATTLLTGFGDGPEAANASRLPDWQAAVNQSISDARLCHADVSVVAHSLGTAVSTLDLVANGQGVSHLVLLSPYFKTYGSWAVTVTGMLASHADALYLSTLETYLHVDPYKAFAIDRPAAGEREAFVPLQGLHEALSVQDEFTTPPKSAIALPVFVVASDADPVVDVAFAEQYLKMRFVNPTFLNYPDGESVGHSLEQRSVNPHYDDMMRSLLTFLDAKS